MTRFIKFEKRYRKMIIINESSFVKNIINILIKIYKFKKNSRNMILMFKKLKYI